jgi:hypothetical protein
VSAISGTVVTLFISIHSERVYIGTSATRGGINGACAHAISQIEAHENSSLRILAFITIGVPRDLLGKIGLLMTAPGRERSGSARWWDLAVLACAPGAARARRCVDPSGSCDLHNQTMTLIPVEKPNVLPPLTAVCAEVAAGTPADSSGSQN